MIYQNYLNEILGKKSRLEALRCLLNFPDGLGVRDLSRRIAITEPNLSRILKELAEQEVLIKHKHGTSLVFRLNHKHYLVEKVVLPLFQREKSILGDLAKFLGRKIKTDYVSMILFGSVARGAEKSRSDLDIAFIVDSAKNAYALEEEMLNVNVSVVVKFGNHISPYIIKKSDFKKKYTSGDSLIRTIAKEGKVLAGSYISDIL